MPAAAAAAASAAFLAVAAAMMASALRKVLPGHVHLDRALHLLRARVLLDDLEPERVRLLLRHDCGAAVAER